MKAQYQILSFKDSKQWKKWLHLNHSKADGLWLRLFKKATKIPSVTYEEALDEALCYGWIDGQRKTYCELSYIQKFTPRRQKSMWSKKNIQNIQRLKIQNRIMPKGIEQVQRAQKDGRWDVAYQTQKNMVIPEDFIAAVKKDAQIQAFYNTLSKSNLFAIYFKLQTAKKPETRANRFNQLLEMLKKGQKPK